MSESNKHLAAIYPGTFDPFTYGHADIAHRASRLFDRVVVAIADSPEKAPLFTFEERIDLTKAVLKHLPNVEVIGFRCLLIELAKQLNVQVVVRGLRAVSDFEYEFQLAMMNRHMSPDFESIFLTPSEEYMFVSSTLIRGIARYQGNVSQFVHPLVYEAIRQKLGY